ncbi:MAG: M20 family peptidase, partial [Thermoproteota archaeon]
MELEIADWLGDVLEELGFSVIRQKFNESRMNLFAFKRPEMVKLLLCGHLDTVPPTEGWKENPFVPKVKRGKLIGLGACDMKGAIATMIVAGIEAISESDEVGVGLLFTSDEEVGMSGARMA